MIRILIFSGRHDLPSDAGAFSFFASLRNVKFFIAAD